LIHFYKRQKNHHTVLNDKQTIRIKDFVNTKINQQNAVQ